MWGESSITDALITVGSRISTSPATAVAVESHNSRRAVRLVFISPSITRMTLAPNAAKGSSQARTSRCQTPSNSNCDTSTWEIAWWAPVPTIPAITNQLIATRVQAR